MKLTTSSLLSYLVIGINVIVLFHTYRSRLALKGLVLLWQALQVTPPATVTSVT